MSGTTRDFKEKQQREKAIKELVKAASDVLILVDGHITPALTERLRKAIEVLK